MNDSQPPRYPRHSCSLIAAGFLVTVVLASAHAQRDADVFGTFDGDPMYTLLEPDAIPAIRDPEFVSGEEARAQMSADEPVLGVVIGGDALAYSLWQLDAHEIVNDVVGGRAIAVTW